MINFKKSNHSNRTPLKKHQYLLGLLLCFTILSNAQSPTLIAGIIVDATTNLPIEQVNIYNQTANSGNTSELDGTFKIEISNFPSTLIFSYVGYENHLLELKTAPKQPLKISLKRSSLGLPEIEITAQPINEKLTNKSYSVKDYLLDGQQVLILTQEGTQSGNSLMLQNWDGEMIDELFFKKEKVNRLHRGCLGSIHLIGQKFGFEIKVVNKKIELLAKYPAQQFEEFIEPCVTSSPHYIYLRKYKLRNQLLTYEIVSKKEKDIVDVISIIDRLNLKRGRDDYVLQYQLAAIDAMKAPSEVELQSWDQLMFKQLYSPLFAGKKELFLLNHTGGYFDFIAFEGKTIRSIPITYHKNKNWIKIILLDKSNDNIYTAYHDKKGQTIYKINKKDGTIAPVLFVENEFVERMEIHNGFLFYLESGVTSSQRNRILHRIAIPN